MDNIIISNVNQLPDICSANDIIVDFETTSFDSTRGGLHPYKGDRICGIAATTLTTNKAWYIPIRHKDIYCDDEDIQNIPIENAINWLNDLLSSKGKWINHNVKFDAHFAHVEGITSINRNLICTLTGAKLVYSDMMYQGGYSLSNLSKLWLKKDISSYDKEIKQYLRNLHIGRKAAKDYALVPIDLLGRYACYDVRTAKDLYLYIENILNDDERKIVWETEKKLTNVLFDIEKEGLKVDLDELECKEYVISIKLRRYEEELENIFGFSVNPKSNKDCYEVLINQFDLPVLELVEKTKNPSFDKNALSKYLELPDVINDSKKEKVVNIMLKHRKLSTLLSIYIQPYQIHASNKDQILHSSYNQCVRTGRLSSRQPNSQQLNKKAKELIHCNEGESFLSADYSQIEFRIMVHVIKDIEAIKAYRNNPDTDFHQWVADMCKIDRSPAKNVNFAIGFGAGRAKVLSMLSTNKSITAEMGEKIDKMIERDIINPNERMKVFEDMCKKRASFIYNLYHNTLPGIRTCSRLASTKTANRGYIRTLYKRRRHINKNHAHIAFNALIQGTAADILKEILIKVSPRYNKRIREWGIRIAAIVHDDILFIGPTEIMHNKDVQDYIRDLLESPSYDFLIPIKTSMNISDTTWGNMEKT